MADLAKKYSFTDVPSTFLAANPNRDEVILRAADGSGTVWLTPNDDATDSQGIFLEAKDTLVLTGNLSKAAWSGVCASGETGTIYGVLEG